MQFSDEVYYRAICARDHHFDGQFVRASRRLKIYCRPTCATPAPKPENCLFFQDAAIAQASGYRPCRRCRPDALPTAPRWSGTISTIARALRLIAAGALDDKGVDELASRVGITDRHLRRLFKQHLGCSPVSIAIARRLAVARQMIEGSNQPFINIAYEAGFSSVRRFNDAFRKAYQLNPSVIRSTPPRQRTDLASEVYMLRLGYQLPFDWPLVRHSLSARSLPSIEYVAENLYQRAVEVRGKTGLVTLRFPQNRPYVEATISQIDLADLPGIVSSTRNMLDLDTDPIAIGRHFTNRPELREQIKRHPGVRVLGWWDNIEYVLRAILAEHLGARWRSALRNLIRLTSKEVTLKGPDIFVSKSFPSMETLAASENLMATIGIPREAIDTITSIAKCVSTGKLSLSRTQSPTIFQRDLMAVPGMNSSFARDIAQNVLERADTFSVTDVQRLSRMAIPSAVNTSTTVLAVSDEWRPWRAYAAALFQEEQGNICRSNIVAAMPVHLPAGTAPITLDIGDHKLDDSSFSPDLTDAMEISTLRASSPPQSKTSKALTWPLK